jgi:hypothetical protein
MEHMEKLIQERIQKLEDEILQQRGVLNGDDLAMLGRIEFNLRSTAERMKNK